MAFLDRFRKHGGLLCPRCEEALDTHDEEKCRNRMTRRHFVGMWGATVAVAYGGGKVMLATESHVKAVEKEFGAYTYMLSHKNGRISSSLVSPARVGELSNQGMKFSRREPALEVLKLRALGFHVSITDELRKHEAQARTVRDNILSGRVPDTDPNSEFPSVYRW